MATSKFQRLVKRAYTALEASKQVASPLEWARVHDVQARLATAVGLRRAFNRKKVPRKKRAPRKKKES
jgi:hypothetical protein